MKQIINDIRQCNLCHDLPMGPNPVVQLGINSRILIIGQAPGRKVHQSGVPWDDKSGDTLRQWLGVSKEVFYDPEIFAIMGMSFCYPGKGISGDLPPRPTCSKTWHKLILDKFGTKPITLLIGQYAQRHYLPGVYKGVTDTVKNFESFLPEYFSLPHPSPRNQNWLKINPWFAETVLPELRMMIKELLEQDSC
ncbi:MAG TPA: uracil-DNA glycosylase family protein [Flavobacterium sp.]|jgi:uracil-DNA glycosylase